MMESDTATHGSTQDIEKIAREVGGKKTRTVLAKLRKQDYIGALKDDLGVAHQTVLYHIKKLLDHNLVEKTGEANGKVFYRITEKGKNVLSHLNV